MHWSKAIIYKGTKKFVDSATEKLYKLKNILDIHCPFCNAKLTICKRGNTYFFASTKNSKHSKTCPATKKLMTQRKTVCNKKNIKESMLTSIKYILNNTKSTSNTASLSSRSSTPNTTSEHLLVYSIESLSDLEKKLTTTKLAINSYCKLMLKIDNLKISDNFFYINTFAKIPIYISLKNASITKEDIKSLKLKNLNLRNNYIFCYAKIIKNKNGDLRIYPCRDSLHFYIFNKNKTNYFNFKRLFE